MVQKTNIIKKLEEFGQKLQSELDVKKVILFGSYARGNPTRDSDIDMIVVSPKFRGIPFYKRSRGLRKKFALRVPMDIICLTPKEFEEKKKEISIVAEAVKEGKEIFVA